MKVMNVVDSAEMANILGVTSYTVIKMAKKRIIPYGRYSTYGPYRFNPDAVLKSLGLDVALGDHAAYLKQLKETNNAAFTLNRELMYGVQSLTRKVEKLESKLESIKEVLK